MAEFLVGVFFGVIVLAIATKKSEKVKTYVYDYVKPEKVNKEK